MPPSQCWSLSVNEARGSRGGSDILPGEPVRLTWSPAWSQVINCPNNQMMNDGWCQYVIADDLCKQHHITGIANEFIHPLTYWLLGDVVIILCVISKFMRTSCGIILRWMPQNIINKKSTSVQVMAWCHQVASHYQIQYWPRSIHHIESLGHN